MNKICIAAGGTGGHINAALSIGDSFVNEYEVQYLSGTRYLDYQLFKDKNVLHLESKPLRTKNPIIFIVNIFLNILVFLKIIFLYIGNRPRFVLGAGGYICGPTLMAAKFLMIPIFIVEQNAVAGVTNKILSKVANIIFTNFKDTKGLTTSKPIIRSGNPIGSSIKESKNIIDDELKILVFGGSLGAMQINTAIETIVQQEPSRNYNIIHQVGKDNIKKVSSINELVKYEQVEYISNMSEKYLWCNIIISRAGASTISELRKVKKPSILIPYPQATDNHQYFNACELKSEDGFFVDVLDHELSGKDLSQRIIQSIENIAFNNLYYKNKIEEENANEIIKDEIKKYVRD